MAILQEANAVFYHPLDNLTESLKSQPWVGPSLFNTGKVVDALHQDSGNSISGFTAGAEYHNAGISVTSVVVMNASTRKVRPRTDSRAEAQALAGGDIEFGGRTFLVDAFRESVPNGFDTVPAS